MDIRMLATNQLIVSFDHDEREFLKNEAEANDITIREMFEVVFGIVFVSGYSKLIGKE